MGRKMETTSWEGDSTFKFDSKQPIEGKVQDFEQRSPKPLRVLSILNFGKRYKNKNLSKLSCPTLLPFAIETSEKFITEK